MTSLSESLFPSFLFQGNAYDERVDIFSFGIIVCEVDHFLCQMLPFLIRNAHFKLLLKYFLCFISKIISRVKASPDFIPRTKVSFLHIFSFLHSSSSLFQRFPPLHNVLVPVHCPILMLFQTLVVFLKKFGLDEPSFEEKFCETCPKAFFQISCLCCDLDPSAR